MIRAVVLIGLRNVSVSNCLTYVFIAWLDEIVIRLVSPFGAFVYGSRIAYSAVFGKLWVVYEVKVLLLLFKY